MKVSVCIPSYHRPEVETKYYLPFAKVYVDPDEYKEYVKFNQDMEIKKCRKGVQGNVSRVRNYIFKQEFGSGADVVCIIDDDLEGIYFWEGNERVFVETRDFLNFVKKFSQVAKDMGVYFWGINIVKDKIAYRECTPFSFINFIGGPFQCFLKGNECYYDNRLYLKEDYDMTIQQLNRYRKVLRINKYHYICKQSEQEGGCAAQRNMEAEKEQFDLLQRKWGADIVREDRAIRHNLKKDKRYFDYNPIIKVPIKGV